ncbi:MAG TPA: CopG family transcriptional regulator [Longimicrobiaceae bacterium]|nr:CopG family transcriptional regulator [Longimicrobiaceae bacterium]
MSEVIPVTLPATAKAELDKYSREDGVSQDDLIREAVEEYLVARRVREIRERVVPQAQAQGFFTDEDVFRAIS